MSITNPNMIIRGLYMFFVLPYNMFQNYLDGSSFSTEREVFFFFRNTERVAGTGAQAHRLQHIVRRADAFRRCGAGTGSKKK